MFCTIINDCRDTDALGRQTTRISSLLGVGVNFVGVRHELSLDESVNSGELEAAGCLVDALDAAEGRKGLYLVNVAHRHGKGKKWPNGTPFGYFWYKDSLVVSTIDGVTLSLAKKVGILKELYVTDVPTVVEYFVANGVVSEDVGEHIKQTQFRSFDYSPRLGAYLLEGKSVPAQKYDLAQIEEVGACVWYIDNFGNCKTTILPGDIGFVAGKSVATAFGSIACYERLKDVPNGESALIVGSSGIEDARFVELVVQGKSAAQHFGVKVGSRLL